MPTSTQGATLTEHVPAQRDRTTAEAAAELGMSESWLRKKGDSVPRTKYGWAVRFTTEQIAEIRRMHGIAPLAGDQ